MSLFNDFATIVFVVTAILAVGYLYRIGKGVDRVSDDLRHIRLHLKSIDEKMTSRSSRDNQ